MTLATTYFAHLKAYLNENYIVHSGTGGLVVLSDKYYSENGETEETRRVELLHSGPCMACKLDLDVRGLEKIGRQPPLFHFLDDNAKPWSKRCDFVVFYVDDKRFHADCIEFKSGIIKGSNIKSQLSAGVSWLRSLKKVIKYYTGDERKIRVRKFVFGTSTHSNANINSSRQLNSDPSIRYYHYDEIQGLSLVDLKNNSILKI